ncbi:unnamed protein product [Peniophora sp. CBMAI 1063]|nr:unnamed protein product [Peniophora sp. CBMAI 1063]
MTSDVEQRPTKHARSTLGPVTDDSLERDSVFWFNDGNIILACGHIGFRVHAGVLSLNCGVFRDMLASGTPAAGEVHEGVDIVRLSDEPADMRLFLRPMYFTDEGPMLSQYYVAQLKTLLDMARKYMADRLQKSVLQHLRTLFPSTQDCSRALYPTLRPPNKTEEKPFDPWVAVDISLDHDIPIILPMAIYYSIVGAELEEILDFNISAAALRKILLFRETFVRRVNRESVDGEGYFDVYSACDNNVASCTIIDLCVQENAIRYYRDFEYDVFQQVHADAVPDDIGDLCAGCRQQLVDMQREFTQYLWNELPLLCRGSLYSWRLLHDAQAEVEGVTAVPEDLA